MARRSSSRRSAYTNAVANDPLLSLPVAPGLSSLQYRNEWNDTLDRLLWMEAEDRRAWHPLGDDADALSRSGVPARTSHRFQTLRPAVNLIGAAPRLAKSIPGFVDPRRVMACLRRAARREVLHALRRTGKGSGGGKKHFNNLSKVRC